MKETENANKGLQRLYTKLPQQWLYLFSEGGVVYSEMHNRYAGLDAAGVAAYRAFDAGATVEDLNALGHISSESSAEPMRTIHELSEGVFPAEDLPVKCPALQYPCVANMEIDGIPLLVEFPAGTPQELSRDYFRHCLPCTKPAHFHISAQRVDDGWTIHGNGRELLSSLSDNQLGLGFLHAARSLLYAEARYDVAFHAAMVAKADRGILLCAPREAGKSTLAAYLVAHGFQLLADEPALLHLDTGSVSALGLPIALKEGSWPLLEAEWPQLKDAAVHIRSDGMRIRLLHPPSSSNSPSSNPTSSRRLTSFLFPEYVPFSAARATRLPPLQTLSFLNDAGSIMAKHFSRETFEAFLALICATPAFALQFASLQEAASMIDDLNAECTP
jgi:hypothetical protein